LLVKKKVSGGVILKGVGEEYKAFSAISLLRGHAQHVSGT